MFITLIITIMVQTFYATTCSPPQGLLIYGGGGNQRSGGYSFDDIAADTIAAINVFEQLATDSFIYANFPAEQAIIAKHRAYMVLNLNPAVKSSSAALQSFFSAADAGNIGKLFRTEKAISEGNLNDAQTLLNTVTPANAIEVNYKAFYTAYLHMKQGSFTAADSAEINRLVHGCAPRDGIVVYQSRALHRILYKDFKTYFDDCPSNKQQAFKIAGVEDNSEPLTSAFRLYPNPNDGNMVLEYHLNENEVGDLLLHDVTGKKIAVYSLDNERNSLTISEAALKNGVYFYNITINNKVVETNRIVIVR